MSEFNRAAELVADAMAVGAARVVLLGKVATWAEENPYTVYGDRNDELSDDQIELLLTDRQAFDESWWEVEMNASDYCEWGDHYKNLCEEFGEDIIACYPDELAGMEADELEWSDVPDDVQQAFHENSSVDCSDLLDTCLRHASPKIIAIPLDSDAPDGDDDEGEQIGPPNGDLDDEQNEARVKYLADKFGIDGWAAESCYYHETLKVMGTLDLRDVYKNGKPKSVTIGPDSKLIFHTSWNGSGCMGDVTATKTVTLPAIFKLDAGNYGIQAVYGFVGSMWADELTVAEWEEWD